MASFTDSSDEENYDESALVRDFEAESQLIIKNLLPKKSKNRYNQVYEAFLKWQQENKINSFEEKLILVYFKDLTKQYKLSTVWGIWSMLCATLRLNQNVDMNNYLLLKNFVNNFSKGYKPKKAKVFNWSQVEKFLKEAPDDN